jgi:site-specific DNA-methyltransferase (adenine-specific)
MSAPRKETLAEGVTLYMGDCLEVLPTVGMVDAVITDPPYSSGGQFRGDRAQEASAKYVQSGSGNKEISSFSGDNRDQRSFHFWSALWSSAALRVTKDGGIGAFFTDWRQLPISTDYMQAGGWVWRGVVPWVKPSYRPSMGRFGAQCEYLVWGSAGPLPVEREVGCLPGFYKYNPPQDREHITQKPEELMADIIQIVPVGGIVLDPFMGSGTTGVAAVTQGRRFVGIEMKEEFFDIACRRIEAALREPGLFIEPPKPIKQEAFL